METVWRFPESNGFRRARGDRTERLSRQLALNRVTSYGRRRRTTTRQFLIRFQCTCDGSAPSRGYDTEATISRGGTIGRLYGSDDVGRAQCKLSEMSRELPGAPAKEPVTKFTVGYSPFWSL